MTQPNVDLKIKNNAGQSAFAAALICKNNNVTRLILKKEPNAAEQVKSKKLVKSKL